MELPVELIKQFKELELNTENMIDDMLIAASETVKGQVESNVELAFEDTKILRQGLYVTKPYTVADGSKHIKIGFDGYAINKSGKRVPIPLVAMAREYGTSRGEKKKPFFRKSFRSQAIENAMLKAQKKYIPEE